MTREAELIRALAEDLALEILASYTAAEDFEDADFSSLAAGRAGKHLLSRPGRSHGGLISGGFKVWKHDMTGSTAAPGKGDFYGGLAVFSDFAQLTDPEIYQSLPDGWVLGLADIVQSTAAIGSGRYKAVNTAAASVIAAVANAMPDKDFPFAFGGDGASFALPADCAELGRNALASVAAWVRDDVGMDMRVALVPITAVRAAGFDVRVARFAPSPDVSYAMFSGGGLAWAEQQMKAGAYIIAPAAADVHPNLTGLSCRFDEIQAQRGVILSLILVPYPGAAPEAFRELVGRVLSLAENSADAGRPVPEGGPPPRWPPSGFELEAKALGAAGRSKLVTRLSLGARTLAAHLIFRTGLRVGGFDPARYRQQLVRNTDFRKFDDGLRMTLDCTPELADRVEAVLASARASGIGRYGVHRQGAALMTCFVPSPTRSDHVHFIDGAMGGYAAAAGALKARM
jgi:Protein of unknown function (DUF3095)